MDKLVKKRQCQRSFAMQMCLIVLHVRSDLRKDNITWIHDKILLKYLLSLTLFASTLHVTKFKLSHSSFLVQ